MPEVAVVSHALPHRVVAVALAQHGHLRHQRLVALGHHLAVVGPGKEEVVVVDAVGAQRHRAHGLEDLGEVALRIELQDILCHGGVGRVGAEVDVVAEGDGHAEGHRGLGGIDDAELSRGAVVGDDVGALAVVVARNVAVGDSVNQRPEGVERDAAVAERRGVHVDQHAGDVAGGGDVDVVAAQGHAPGVAVLAVAALDESVHLSLAAVGVRYFLHGVVDVVVSAAALVAADLEGGDEREVVAEGSAVAAGVALAVEADAEGRHLAALGGVHVENLVERLAVQPLTAQRGIAAAVAALHPGIAHGGQPSGLNGVDEGRLDVVAVVEAVHVASHDDGTAVQAGHDVGGQLLPLSQAGHAVAQVVVLLLVAGAAGVHVHIVDHHTMAVGERQLMPAEALGDDVVEVVAELAEALRPWRAHIVLAADAFLPEGVQAVAAVLPVLQVGVVDVLAQQADAARPFVFLVVEQQVRPDFPSVVEVLLQADDVAALLRQVLADAQASAGLRSVGVDVEEGQLAGQSVDVERGHGEGRSGAALAEGGTGKE